MWSKPSTANASIRVLLPEPGPPVMTWKSGRSAIARTFRFRVERALPPPLPERQHIASVVALNARCTIEQRAVKGGAIIVGQLDQTGFLDEAAPLYEMARALASGNDPHTRTIGKAPCQEVVFPIVKASVVAIVLTQKQQPQDKD